MGRRKYVCVYNNCQQILAPNMRFNIERHVWTRHVRQTMGLRHLPYVAKFHKVHVDDYVCAVTIDKDDLDDHSRLLDDCFRHNRNIHNSNNRNSNNNNNNNNGYGYGYGSGYGYSYGYDCGYGYGYGY
eukprot:Pgem_evm1s10432